MSRGTTPASDRVTSRSSPFSSCTRCTPSLTQEAVLQKTVSPPVVWCTKCQVRSQAFAASSRRSGYSCIMHAGGHSLWKTPRGLQILSRPTEDHPNKESNPFVHSRIPSSSTGARTPRNDGHLHVQVVSKVGAKIWSSSVRVVGGCGFRLRHPGRSKSAP